MGHTRLGRVPTSKKWKEVVALLVDSLENADKNDPTSDVQKIASKTIEAADKALAAALKDGGFSYSFFLCTQIALAAKADDCTKALQELGIKVSDNSSAFDLVAAVQESIDNHIWQHGSVTDVSELAQQSTAEALSRILTTQQLNLFGDNKTQLRDALHSLSTKNGFSDFGQKFFGSFLNRFLSFYLSRALPIAGGDQIKHVGDINSFNEALRNHSDQTALIVRNFCGDWYSKTEYLEGITVSNSKKFVAISIKKLRAELLRQGAEQ